MDAVKDCIVPKTQNIYHKDLCSLGSFYQIKVGSLLWDDILYSTWNLEAPMRLTFYLILCDSIGIYVSSKTGFNCLEMKSLGIQCWDCIGKKEHVG